VKNFKAPVEATGITPHNIRDRSSQLMFAGIVGVWNGDAIPRARRGTSTLLLERRKRGSTSAGASGENTAS
jgi:hypothetical protein